jgi:hypothetical protein
MVHLLSLLNIMGSALMILTGSVQDRIVLILLFFVFMASVSIIGGDISATDRITDDANQPFPECNQCVKL